MVCRVAKSVIETQGVTHEAVMKIAQGGKTILLSHLDTWGFVWAIVTSMRVKLLLLATVTLMLLLTCCLGPLLTSQSSTEGSRKLVTVALVSHQGLQTVLPPVINATITAEAAVEPMEKLERTMIAGALQYASQMEERGKSEPLVRTTAASALPGQQDQPQPTRRRREPWAAELYRAVYATHWPKFQKLLQVWAQMKLRFQPCIMGQLLEDVKAPLDSYRNVSNALPTQRYNTCAVVGNSGILLSSSQGSFIDSHDMVIRINMATTKGFTSHVGSKTTLAFVNSNVLHTCARLSSCPCHHFGDGVPVLTYMCTPLHLIDIARCTTRRTVPLLVTDPRFDTLSYRIVKWYSLTHYALKTGRSVEQWAKTYGGDYFHYSSGFQAVMLALGICNQVDLFGFGKMAGVQHHYHSTQKEELSLHDYVAEYYFYDDVMNNRSAAIPFLQDSGITIPPLRIFV